MQPLLKNLCNSGDSKNVALLSIRNVALLSISRVKLLRENGETEITDVDFVDSISVNYCKVAVYTVNVSDLLG